MAAFRANPPTAFDISPDNLIAPSSSSYTPPCTPSLRRRRAESVGLDDFTPSKRMRLMSASLGATQSSYLVSREPLTSTPNIFTPMLEALPELPKPDWSLLDLSGPSGDYQSRTQLEERIQALTSSLSSAQNQLKAQNLIIEGAHAQLVVQDMILNKQNQTLEAKGKKKNDDRTILFPGGYGRCLTSDEFTALVDAQAAALDKKAEEKRKRAELRQQKRSRKDLVDSRWREAQEKYKDLKAKHEEQCRALLAAGTRKRDLPPGPERVYKKDIEAEIDDMLSGDGSEEEMSEEDE
ncbi:hypothetical protein BKA70DRAFT_1108807 [Coprinopsis sp. MPI-PUGE-AT-0042]|nr:hypothetical protein BKA70DRAFT_1108807 [Coprinopsis sp. MPI-PUGE-AT-0042]